jgi:hypothetical protein
VFKSLFGGQAGDVRDVDGGEAREDGAIWALPDMEAVAAPETREEPRQRLPFVYEDARVHPAGVFTAELVGWQPVDGRRAQWRFLVVAANDFQEQERVPLVYHTGAVCRPGNNLYCLLAAVGAAPGLAGPEGAGPAARADARGAVENLEPEALLGRRCRIRVEHARDELGDVTAAITAVAPIGAM